MDMTISEFYSLHFDGYVPSKYTAKYKSMSDIWHNAEIPEMVVEVATSRWVLTREELRNFGCWCFRQVWEFLPDIDKLAVETMEMYLRGEASEKDIDYVDDLYRENAEGIYGAKSLLYRHMVHSGAWECACHSRRKYCIHKSGGNVKSPEWNKAAAEMYARQAEYLRKNTKPIFSHII